ncbi:MAG: hypothetical protein DKT66_03745 [Candidatus Melainabacteria bacterium]|nr:MAG: hypothetical protein DKT66_03745 [Candidatus Melainabacteria bacterium]
MTLSLTDREEATSADASKKSAESLQNAGATFAQPILHPANTPNATKQEHFFYVDFLRCFAIIQVILLHTSAPFATTTSAKGLFWVGCILDSITRSCVPLFLMISGMLLLSSRKEEPPVTFLQRRLWRVGSPLIAWTVIYCGWRFSRGAQLDWQTVVNQPACYHLQYLYYLIGLYLATPILQAFLRGSGKQEVFYFLAVWLLATSLLPTVGSLTGFLPPFIFVTATGFSGYFILGHALRNYEIPKNRYVYFALSALGCLSITIVGTYLLTFSQPNPTLNETLFNYSSPQIIVYSAILFLAAKTLVGQGIESWADRCIKSVSAASFTVYLVHPLFLTYISTQLKWILDLEAHRSVLTLGYVFSVALVTLLCSWLFFQVCRLLKVPSWLAP